jgi:hypothetical protein
MRTKLLVSAIAFATFTAGTRTHAEPPKRLPPRPTPVVETRTTTVQLEDGRQAEVTGNVLHLISPAGGKTVAPPGTYTTKAGRVLMVEANGIILQRSQANPSAISTPTKQQPPAPAPSPKRSPAGVTKSSPPPEGPVKPQAFPSVTRTVGPVPNPSVHVSTDKPLPIFRVQPKDTSSVAEIDDAVAAVMRLNGVRGAALAIVNRTHFV